MCNPRDGAIIRRLKYPKHHILAWLLSAFSVSPCLVVVSSVLYPAVFAYHQELISQWKTAPKAPASAIMSIPSAEISRTLATLKKRIEEKYAIDIVTEDDERLHSAYDIAVTPFPDEELPVHLHNLNEWLRKYPPLYIRNAGLKTVYLLQDWQVEGEAFGGFLPNTSSIAITSSEFVFHHELFHLADLNDGGLFDENSDWARNKWGALPTEIRKGNGLEAIRLMHRQEDISRPQGYVSLYGKLGGVDEDQATMVELLLTRPQQLLKLSEKDIQIANGTSYLKEFFYARSNGMMDERFWSDLILKNDVPDDYWDKRHFVGDYRVTEAYEPARLNYLDLLRARTLLAAGDTAEAENVYKNIIQRTPKRTNVTRELGLIYESLGRYADANAIYRAKGVTQPDHFFDLSIAKNEVRLGNMESAVLHYLLAWRKEYLSPEEMTEFQSTYERYAVGLAKAGKRQDAAQAYRIMLRIFGSNPKWESAAKNN